ncbi:MAG TPA: NAD(P)H-hydrate dehydratase [Steroidobacteraceae bacterium]|nr:NAD(P)H-hydrate dehydratase [Steroidobacteraceae bacterium]
MEPLPALVYSTAAIRAADRYAIETLGVPGYTLMTRAGEAALSALRSQWPLARRLLVLAGPGNNGGDGYVVARFARAAGLEVTVAAPAGEPKGGDAARAAADWRAAGGTTQPFAPNLLAQADLIVDALLGTGLVRDVEPGLAALISVVNASGRAIVSLDVPSGLDTDTGQVRGVAIRAALTVTFVGLKPGLFLGAGPEHIGRLVCDDLEVAPAAFANAVPALRRIPEREMRALLPRRARTAHKGVHGRVLIVGGGAGMPGAARLAGEAALRAGAGLVTVATWPAHAAALAAGRPELICLPVEKPADLNSALAAADVVAIGPGLGRSSWAEGLWRAVLATDVPLIVDADALNLLAAAPARSARWCLTPHPGEAGRLLGSSAEEVQSDRLSAVRALAARYDGVAVLKGAGTLVAAGDSAPWVCERGNPGMGAAGMGDVLTGVIAAIAAQQADPLAALGPAAAVAVLVHAQAGDLAARGGERGILASDLIAQLPACVNPAG